MKKIHYQNLGFPRSGTTWLWKSLINHPEIFKTQNFIKRRNFIYNNKEPKGDLLIGPRYALPKNLQPMIDRYSEFDISLNFNAFNFLYYDLDKIAEYTTHASIILRNPYEVVYSYYNYYNSSFPSHPKMSIDDHIKVFNFTNTIKKWSKFKNKFKVFYFEDLKSDQKLFYNEVCNFIDIEPKTPLLDKENSLEFVLKTENGIEKEVVFTAKQCEILNNEIENLSNFLSKDLRNWKKYS